MMPHGTAAMPTCCRFLLLFGVLLVLGCESSPEPATVDIAELDPQQAEVSGQAADDPRQMQHPGQAAHEVHRGQAEPQGEPAGLPPAGDGDPTADPTETEPVRAESPRELIDLVREGVGRGQLALVAELIDATTEAGRLAVETHQVMDRVVQNNRMLRQAVVERFGHVDQQALSRVMIDISLADGPIAAMAGGTENLEIEEDADTAVLTPHERFDHQIELVRREGRWLINFAALPEDELPGEADFAFMHRLESVSADLIELVGESESFEQFLESAEEKVMDALMEPAE